MKTTDFITENQFIGDDAHAMHQDHEVQMARGDCYSSAKYAIELHKLLKNVSEMQGLDGWVSEKLTLANDYLRTVHEYLSHEMVHPEEVMPEMFTAESAEIQFAELLGETAGKQVDMTGKPCTACKKGTYQETTQHDDMDGVLHCTKCRKQVKRHQSAKPKEKGVAEGGRLDMSSPEEKAARKAYIKAHGHPPPLTPDSVVAKYNPENDKKVRDYYLRRKGIPQDKLDKMKEDGVAEAGPGDINRLEHRGAEYNVYFNQRKGMYTARGTGQMSGQIQPEWFYTLADAQDHAEMEIGGYDEHDGVAESDPLANRDAYAKQHQQGQVYKTHYPKGENPFHKAGMKDKRSTKMSAYDISNTGPKGQLPESDVAEGEKPEYQKLLKQIRQKAKNDPNRIPRGYELTAHGELVKKHPTEKSNDGVGGLGEASKEKTPGVALSKAYRKDFDGKRPGQDRPETALTGAYSKTGKPGGALKKSGVAETTSSAGMATAPGVGKGPKTGTLFGGSYAPQTPFTGKKKAKTSVIKR
jgi:hypothetical protein